MTSPVEGFMDSIKTKEVSFVKRPANRRDFLITKGVNSMEELLQAVLETEADNESDLRDALKSRGLDESAVEVAAGIARLASAYSDEFDADAFVAIGKAIGFDLDKTEEPKPETVITKTELEAIPAELRGRVEGLIKSNETLGESVEALAKRLDAADEAARLAEYVSKAEGLDHISATADELGQTLKTIADADSGAAEKVLEILRAANTQVEKSDVIGVELGSSRVSTVGGSVAEEVEQLATELVKSDSELTLGEARDRVLKSNRELAQRYFDAARNGGE